MRQVLRRAVADGHRAHRRRVRCVARAGPGRPRRGAAVDDAIDAQTLRGLPKVKVGVSWVPWTHRRLAAASGYGAGVRSPGWYAHVFDHPGEVGVSRWFVGAARLLRDRGMSASPDDLIAATRAATALAALRNRPRPGLGRGARCRRHRDGRRQWHGADPARADRRRRHRRGARRRPAGAAWPATSPPSNAECGSSRRPSPQTVELDVRAPNGRARSVLLHRLRALGVPWGSVEEGRGSSGTFRETWRLLWEPELTIRVIELSAHGTTVQAAATHRLLERADAVDGAGRPGRRARPRPARRPARRRPAGRRPGRGPGCPRSRRGPGDRHARPARPSAALRRRARHRRRRAADCVRRAGGPRRRRCGHGLPLARR